MNLAHQREGIFSLALITWLLDLPEHRRLVALLAGANLIGAAYGFLWYAGQLSTSPQYLWPVIPDSPLAALSFGLFLMALYLGRRIPLLEAFAYLSMIKYGLWTVLVLGQDMVINRAATFEGIHLTASHFIMAVQPVIFMRRLHPGLAAGAAAWAWFLFNDYMDYFQGTHPYLPDPSQIGYVRGVAYFTSLAAITCFVYFFRNHRSSELRSAP